MVKPSKDKGLERLYPFDLGFRVSVSGIMFLGFRCQLSG